MVFADCELAKRLEAAEGYACAQFAEARTRVFPECRSKWMRCAGATVVFDGVGAPTTEAGSSSQRNAERKGFRVAYTRLKWKLVGRM